MVSIYVFILGVLIGLAVITKVPPLLHTPLMSGSNAVSGITVVGAIISAGVEPFAWQPALVTILGVLAVICAMINVVGGFLVTDRMLEMFKDKKKEK
jgi:NAD(P) transhydrogenase subunit alpha